MKNNDYRGARSTEFLLAVGVLLLATYLLAFDKIPPGTWENIAMAVLAAYAFGRVGAKTTEALRDRGNGHPPPP